MIGHQRDKGVTSWGWGFAAFWERGFHIFPPPSHYLDYPRTSSLGILPKVRRNILPGLQEVAYDALNLGGIIPLGMSKTMQSAFPASVMIHGQGFFYYRKTGGVHFRLFHLSPGGRKRGNVPQHITDNVERISFYLG